ncbi:hypothetical protein MYAER_1864 [Microcystis aeruginosa NIES-2549]|uniref:Uncharacterized protein n=1 Tax=Microcystis aeruginosa NIES-2549 TaxID=1641812 RepID=A0A0F6U3Z3_MICAE|nr:hypothetical protein MYAER_1864 [Microcystis aeruginosa NIES-2549]
MNSWYLLKLHFQRYRAEAILLRSNNRKIGNAISRYQPIYRPKMLVIAK